MSLATLVDAFPELEQIPHGVRDTLENDARYHVYLKRQETDIANLRAAERREIPPGFDYALVPGLSTEVRDRLSAVRPRTLAQASRVEGVTPTATTIIAAHLREGDRFAARTRVAAS
jgi:tRNA uridine 5-carboxymethylaminomethyl modification enzyme